MKRPMFILRLYFDEIFCICHIKQSFSLYKIRRILIPVTKGKSVRVCSSRSKCVWWRNIFLCTYICVRWKTVKLRYCLRVRIIQLSILRLLPTQQHYDQQLVPLSRLKHCIHSSRQLYFSFDQVFSSCKI